MPHVYTEDQLVEQPAIGLFAELGWQTVSALEETFGATGTLLRWCWCPGCAWRLPD
jgi:type I restriction enzyme R subunit